MSNKFKKCICKINLYLFFILGGAMIVLYIVKFLFWLISFLGIDLTKILLDNLGQNGFKTIQIIIFLIILPFFLFHLDDRIKAIIKKTERNMIILFLVSLGLWPIYATHLFISIIAVSGK